MISGTRPDISAGRKLVPRRWLLERISLSLDEISLSLNEVAVACGHGFGRSRVAGSRVGRGTGPSACRRTFQSAS
ncbi:hypothetical protein [Streptoalloteichus hindustanus]|uniref:hypothetical protein n=1 Tax=Streptoalloteichus hindustanus TaxID=2017 RepID=UPI001160F611|nr:hypothetical protein [Streptoalloteichus hindustanus]